MKWIDLGMRYLMLLLILLSLSCKREQPIEAHPELVGEWQSAEMRVIVGESAHSDQAVGHIVINSDNLGYHEVQMYSCNHPDPSKAVHKVKIKNNRLKFKGTDIELYIDQYPVELASVDTFIMTGDAMPCDTVPYDAIMKIDGEYYYRLVQ